MKRIVPTTSRRRLKLLRVVQVMDDDPEATAQVNFARMVYPGGALPPDTAE
jgi:hypothetical protein